MKIQISSRVETIVKFKDADEIARVETLRTENPTRSFSDPRMTSEWERESIEMSLVYDLVRALCQYTLDTDEVESFNSGLSLKGNFEINGTITRDGKQYDLSTEVIIAEGPIIAAHYRYITKTNLPKSSDSSEAKKVKQMITKKNKMHSLETDIKRFGIWIKEEQADLDEMEARTDQDWIDAINNSMVLGMSPMLTENFKSVAEFDSWQQENWIDMTGYRAWLAKQNKEQLERAKNQIGRTKDQIKRFLKCIAESEMKLNKLRYSK